MKDAVRLYRVCFFSILAWLAMATLLLPAGSFAQDEEQDQLVLGVDFDELIVVTGSRIIVRDFAAPSPVATVDAVDFDTFGAINVEAFLNTLPQFVADLDRTSNNPGNGTATLNLRGLGVQRTLVLLNGRRFVPVDGSGAVNVNNIPSFLLKRVEIVTGGASAVYGSDALAGAVNFIIDSDFTGLATEAQLDITQKGDAEIYNFGLGYGSDFSDGRGHATLFFSFTERKGLRQDARAFSAVTLDDDFFTGEIFEAGSDRIPEGGIFFPDAIINGQPVNNVIFNQDGTLRPFIDPDDRFNFAPDNFLQLPLRRYVGGAFLDYDLTDSIEATLEILFAHNKSRQQLAPASISDFISVNVDNPALPPETQQIFSDSFDDDMDGIADFQFFKRLEELGPRITIANRDTIRIVAGLEGALSDTWTWSAFYSFSETDGKSTLLNDGLFTPLQQGLLVDPVTGQCFDPSNGCVPINPFGKGNLSDAAVDFFRAPTIVNTERLEEQIFTLAITGDAFRLPAGSVGVAFGAEWRRQEGSFNPDPILFTGETLGFNADQPVAGAVTVKELFAEIVIPLIADKRFVRGFSIEAGGRFSDYSQAGSVWTWKGGAGWEITDSFRLRAMFQRAVRAPNILELFRGTTSFFVSSFGANIDPCSAPNDPVGSGVADICVAQGMDPAFLGIFVADDGIPAEAFFGGNPNLKPERADSITAGFVFRPQSAPGLSVTFDYYNIEIKDAILDIEADSFFSCFLIGDPNSQFCQLWRRDTLGNVVEGDLIPVNTAFLKIEGFDAMISYNFDVPSLALFDGEGNFDLSFYGTWTLTNGIQTSPVIPFRDCAGTFGFACSFTSFGTLPEFKTSTTFTYTSGPLSMSARWRWLSGTRNSEILHAETFFTGPFIFAIPEISGEHYIDLSFFYEINDNFAFSFGISNLVNNGPPLMGSFSNQANTDPSTFDVFGRSFFLRLTARFGT